MLQQAVIGSPHGDNVLYEHGLHGYVRVFKQELVESAEFIGYPAHGVPVVDGCDQLLSMDRTLLREESVKAFSEFLAHNDLIDTLFLNPHMADAEANVPSSIDVNAEDAPSPELVIQIEQLLARGHEILGILKKVEANQIAAQ